MKKWPKGVYTGAGAGVVLQIPFDEQGVARIGVTGDTHGSRCLSEIVLRAGTVNAWLHSGDHYNDAYALAELSEAPVVAVCGNCDHAGGPGLAEEFLRIGNKKVMLTHGHRYKVKQGTDELLWWAVQYELDIVVYGHTHVAQISNHDGVLLFNPGSPTLPRHGDPGSFGILTITSENSLTPQFITL